MSGAAHQHRPPPGVTSLPGHCPHSKTPGGGSEFPPPVPRRVSGHQRQARGSSNSNARRAAGVSALSASCALSPSPQVLYRWNRQSSSSIIETNKTSVELSLPFNEDYIIEIKPFSDGGDGSSSEQIRIPKMSSKDGGEEGGWGRPRWQGRPASPRAPATSPSRDEAEQGQAAGRAMSRVGT